MEEEALPFFPEPFARLPVLCQCRAERHRLRRGSQPESCSQLHAAQHAQGVFTKLIRGMAQDVCIEVSPAVEGIAELKGVGVPGHGVHGEIASCQCLVDVHVGIGLSQQSRGGLVIDEHA